MERSKMIQKARAVDGKWDFIIIGGGATGLGTAVDAASRGYKTLLLEMNDFAKGTSSRSTKLVHGGVRYLEQGDISLVFEALKERKILLQNAPHIVHTRAFIVPFYNWWRGPYYWLGLKIYDLLSGNHGIGSSKHLSIKNTLSKLPTVTPKGLKGGIMYYDGQFDDARFAIDLAKTGADNEGTLLNYMKVTDLLKTSQKVQGVRAKDMLSGEEHTFKGRAVINATGVFTDNILKMDGQNSSSVIEPSQGVHIVVDKKFLRGKDAIMIPKTGDGRILFLLPWHDKVIMGTTDTAIENITEEPEAMHKEVAFILENAGKYLAKKPRKSDILSVFAGLRPLVKKGSAHDTSEISRDHSLMVSSSGLVTIAGGKWTTYRKMAEDTVDRASTLAGLDEKECVTENLKIHGSSKNADYNAPLHYYGSDQKKIKEIMESRPELKEPLHERLPYIKAEVVWAVRNEMAMTVEDFCARRSRALLLDAKASEKMAPAVARLMAAEAGYDDKWIEDQINKYSKLAKSYQIS